jgi:hypothetical protein
MVNVSHLADEVKTISVMVNALECKSPIPLKDELLTEHWLGSHRFCWRYAAHQDFLPF